MSKEEEYATGRKNIELIDKVSLKGDVGYFERFNQLPLRHGFSWENQGNMKYSNEPGYPSLKAITTVRSRIKTFLAGLEMNSLSRTVIAAAAPGDLRIADISENSINPLTIQRYLHTFTDANLPLTELPEMQKIIGTYIEAGAFFTTTPYITIYATAGDCTNTFLYAPRQGGNPVIGIIHSGRVEADLHFAQRILPHLEREYGCYKKDILIGIGPGIGPKNYLFYKARGVPINVAEWEIARAAVETEDGYRLDVTQKLIQEYIQAGIQPEKITAYSTDTYEAASQGRGFSHVYALKTNTLDGRFICAIQLTK